MIFFWPFSWEIFFSWIFFLPSFLKVFFFLKFFFCPFSWLMLKGKIVILGNWHSFNSGKNSSVKIAVKMCQFKKMALTAFWDFTESRFGILATLFNEYFDEDSSSWGYQINAEADCSNRWQVPIRNAHPCTQLSIQLGPANGCCDLLHVASNNCINNIVNIIEHNNIINII